MAKKKGNLLGSWAFLIGVIIAIILGALGAVTPVIALILVILGLIVGLLNVTAAETQSFLLAGVALVLVAFLGAGVMSIIGWVGSILNAFVIMFVPATVVVAVKSVFAIASK